MEASVIHAPGGRVPLTLGLLRLRPDDQLLAMFRGGSDEAFGVLHDRYRQRLFAYVRQMLSSCSRQDAEDVLQDVFVRAYGALRHDRREVNVRAWLYRVAHNRCVDHLRRPVPLAADIFQVSRKPLHDPLEEAQRREDLHRLVQDVSRLPDQQRSALLMREMDGMSYADLADALDVTVPAVKSLLVRARIGLVEAIEAREADCGEIRDDLLRAYDRGVKASGRARKHMRSCSGCREYRTALRGVRRSFAALSPVGAGPLALCAKLAGLGASGAGGGAAAAAGGGAAASGSAAAAGGLATMTACKVAAVVCTAALAGSAVEVHRIAARHHARPVPPAASVSAPAPAPAPVTRAAAPIVRVTHRSTLAAVALAAPAARPTKAGRDARRAAPTPAATATVAPTPAATTAPAPDPTVTGTGGAVAPDDPQPATTTAPEAPTAAPAPATTPAPAATATGATATPPPAATPPPTTGGATGPPPG
jgi:RNA polymerase sigma factor (sigma-70 family)